MTTLDDSVRAALRDFRADESDVRAFAQLVVALWRADALATGRGAIHVTFRLSGGLTRRQRARGQSHPWGRRVQKRTRDGHGRVWTQERGLWWSVGPGKWRKPDGRVWIMPASNPPKASVWWNDDESKPFELGELADYLVERATEWRVVERVEKKKAARVAEVRDEYAAKIASLKKDG